MRAELKKLLSQATEHVTKKKHLTATEREAVATLNEHEELALYVGFMVGRMRANGMSKIDILNAISGILRMEIVD